MARGGSGEGGRHRWLGEMHLAEASLSDLLTREGGHCSCRTPAVLEAMLVVVC
jgi:hypothetical protein